MLAEDVLFRFSLIYSFIQMFFLINNIANLILFIW